MTLTHSIRFGEGPRWHKNRLWFSDMHDRKVWAMDMKGNMQLIAELPTMCSGLGFLPDGTPLVVSMEDRKVMRIEGVAGAGASDCHPSAGGQAGGGVLREHADLSGVATWHCNDMVVDKRGGAYVGNFGSDLYTPEQIERTARFEPPELAHLAYVSPEGKVSVAARDLLFPNGSVITEDGKTLIVGETFGLKMSAFDIAEDGSLSNKRTWADLGAIVCPPDGCCLDAENCIWVANPLAPGFCVRIAEGGKVLQKIPAGEGYGCFACALGGPEGKHLFLLESKGHHPHESKLGDGRIRVVEVDVPRAGKDARP